MAILVAGSGQYIIKQVERRRVEPLKIVEKKRQRVLWSGEDADESISETVQESAIPSAIPSFRTLAPGY
jgi:hypothetical protein